MSPRYADTSFLVASFDPHAVQSEEVLEFVFRKQWDYYFNPVLRAELRHALHRLTPPDRTVAWNAYRAAEKWRMRFVPHVFHLSNVLSRADAISEADAGRSGAGTWDIVHIACALIIGSEHFLTCDKAQAEAAKHAGLQVRYFKG